MKYTKIICTIGPASEDVNTIRKLYEAGMNVARLNFSHGTYEYFEMLIKNIRSVSSDIAILLDTKGPEIRTGEVDTGSIILEDNQDLIVTEKKVVGGTDLLTINYKNIEKLDSKCKILIDDGLIALRVVKKTKNGLLTKVLNGGVLGSKKTVTIRGHNVDIPFLSKKDVEDIEFGIKHDMDFVAASFVREASEVEVLRKILDKNKSKIQIISKIEHPFSVDNFDEILEVSNGIMVARGDLGVEIAPQKVPAIQERMIKKCRNAAKTVIIATHMLESMRYNPRPTRAEVSDVAQAVMQGADAVMLSSETASGKYPLKSTQMMSRIAREYDNEVKFLVDEDYKQFEKRNEAISLFITNSAYHASLHLGVKGILVPTESGFTARGVSRFRPKCPIYAMTRNKSTFSQLKLSRNVTSFMCNNDHKTRDDLTRSLARKIYENKLIGKDDLVVVTAGFKVGQKGCTNTFEIYKVRDLL